MGRGAPSSVEVKYSQLLIDGNWVPSASGKTFASTDPYSGAVIAQVAEADKEDVERAVRAARRAFDQGPWPRMSGYQRGLVLNRLADLLEEKSAEMAALETLDNGMPYESALAQVVSFAVKTFRYYAGWADKIGGRTLRADGPYHALSLHEPIGVVGAIIPWNFPLAMFAMKVAPALSVGNAVVVKPAEQTPLTALYAGQLALEAGVPPGVLNLVPGYGPTAGAAIAGHMNVDKVAFTGSTEVGRLIMEAAARSNLKPVTLELGGKSPLVVCQDADLDAAVELAHIALFFNQGQCCCAGSRTYVHESVYDDFVKRSAERASKRVVGDPFQAGVEQGPQVDEAQFQKILGYIESGKQSGARLVCGGSRVGTSGYFIQPTVFADVQDDMAIAREEIFGPVMSILKFKTMEEVISRVNNTAYGLAAGIVTKSLDTADTFSRAVKCGTVWINCFLFLDPNVPFGGYKESGIGRELGPYGLDPYIQVKSVISLISNPAWL